MTLRALLICLLTGLPAAAALAQHEAPFEPDHDGYATVAVPFFERNCLRCHGPREENGNLRVDRLSVEDFGSQLKMLRWGEVLDMINSHQMPPPEERQPNADEAGEFADWVLSQLAAGERAQRTTDFVLRRLNRAEYDNTIRDLVGVDLSPARSFPEDGAASGFDNNGSALTVSPLHLELYYEAARQIWDKAIYTGREPRRLTWRFDPEENTRGLDRLRVDRDGQQILLNPGNNRLENGWTIIHHAFWDTSLGFRNFELPNEGEYIIRFRAYGHVPTRDDVIASVRRLSTNVSASRLAHFRESPIYDYGPPRVRVIQHLDGQPQVFAEMDIAAGESEPGVYEIRAEFTTERAGIQFHYAYDIPQLLENSSVQLKNEFARPELAIDWIEIEGPIHEQWPPASHTRILPSPPGRDEMAAAREVLARFMPRAYRRPVTDAEIEAKLALFSAARKSKSSFEEAIKVPLTAVLTSPHFLFLVETIDPTGARELDGYELASRLSYFLWSSMPDDTLFALAQSGELLRPEVIRGEVDRLLADARSQAFVENFVGQWLGLREVGANPPVPNLYPRYDRHLEQSIVGESESFFNEILHGDLDIRSFIRSDFVTINERLARFYGFEGVRGDEFRRVAVPVGVQRGGLMTQASILTITSNGTRTSPVERGVWVLRTLLGDDPGLPVTNVGEIAPSAPGLDKATVRERLEIHRSLPQCARCHNRIDPLGFALENFDASGAWRLQEGFGWNGRVGADDPYIDASSVMPDGTRIVGVSGLQDALLAREDAFFLALTDRLMTYALGRTLGFADQEKVREIVARLDEEKPTLRSLLHAIATSEQFRNR